MVIFHILKHTMLGSGNACAAVDLACAQADHGHEVYLCHAIGSFGEVLAKHGVNVISLPAMERSSGAMTALVHLHRILRKVRPDIVHAHMMMGTLLAAALRLLVGYRLVTTVHNDFQRSAILMGLGQRVIGVSEAVSQGMIKRGVPASRVRTVLNGTISSARRTVPVPAAMELARPAIVSVCGMHPRKGILDLIDAFALVGKSIPGVNLYFVGSGPKLEEYKALADRLGGGRITFLGYVDDPRPVLLGADIFVLASHAEPAGLVLCEAREAGCAIIASNVGGIPEMIDHGKAGILVTPRQPTEFAHEIIRLLQDPGHLARMRRRASLNLDRFKMERIVAETDRIYGELLTRPQLATA